MKSFNRLKKGKRSDYTWWVGYGDASLEKADTTSKVVL
jgi:hypothetical protein